jgi:hypothetical protein
MILAAVAALLIVAVCSCAELDQTDAPRGETTVRTELEDGSGTITKDKNSTDVTDASTKKGEGGKTGETTGIESEDERTVDGDEMITDETGDTSSSPDDTTARSGSATTRSGSTTTRRDSTTTRSGSTTTRRDSTTTRSGSTTTRSGSTTTRSDPTPPDTAKTPETTAAPTVAEPAPSYPLKNASASAPANANDHSVPKSQIVEGAGPLGDASVYVGLHDFLFYGDSVKDLTGTNLISDSRLSRFADIMTERSDWAKQNGMDLIFVIAPNKATVYNDYVPSSVTQASYTKADQVVEYLAAHSSVRVLDLRRTLRDARSTFGDDLYYKYDTHWNQNGGFAAYGAIMNAVRQTRPGAVRYGYGDFNVNRYETYMKDNAWYLGWYDDYYDSGPVFSLKEGPAAKLVAKTRNGNVSGQYLLAYRWPDGYRDDLTYLYYKSKNTNASSLYMYQDSFGIALMPFLKESFAESNFEWSHNLSKADILEMKPDTIIIEVAEKGLDDFIKLRAFY